MNETPATFGVEHFETMEMTVSGGYTWNGLGTNSVSVGGYIHIWGVGTFYIAKIE